MIDQGVTEPDQNYKGHVPLRGFLFVFNFDIECHIGAFICKKKNPPLQYYIILYIIFW